MAAPQNGPAETRSETDPKALEAQKLSQEIVNLRLAEEKTRRELEDLRRPYLLRNPGTLTAFITTVGALVAAGILIYNNYYQTVRERNALEDEKLQRRSVEAVQKEKESEERLKRAEAHDRAAAELETGATARVADAAARERDAAARISLADKGLQAAETRAKDAQSVADDLRWSAIAQSLATYSRVESSKYEGDLDLAALLGRQALLWNERHRADLLREIDDALRAALARRTYVSQVAGHKQPVTAAAFSPDGRLLASAGRDGEILIRDMHSPGQAPIRLKGANTAPLALAFQPGNRFLAVGQYDGSVELWDLEHADKPKILSPAGPQIKRCLAFSGSGRLLASSAGSTVEIWHTAQYDAEPVRVQLNPKPIRSLAAVPSTERFATGAEDGSIWLWDGENPQASPMIFHARDSADSLAVSPGGRAIASLSSVHSGVSLWDFTKEGPQPEIIQARAGHTGVVFTSDGRRLLVYGDGIQIYPLQSLKTPEELPAVFGSGAISVLAISPDDRTLAIDWINRPVLRIVKLEDTQFEKPVAAIGFRAEIFMNSPGVGPGARTLDFRPGRRELVVGVWPYSPQLWEFGPYPSQPKVVGSDATGAWDERFETGVLSPDGNQVIWPSGESLKIWDLRTPATAGRTWKTGLKGVTALAVSPDGSTLAVASGKQGAVQLWNLREPESPAQDLQPARESISHLSFQSDSRVLAGVTGRDTKLRRWDLNAPGAEPEVIAAKCSNENGLAFAVFHPTVKSVLAAAAPNGTTCLWDFSHKEARSTLVYDAPEFGGAGETALSFSSDGEQLAIANGEMVRVYASRQPRAAPVLLNHSFERTSVAFSRDGSLLATGSGVGEVTLWLTTRGLAERVCERVWRNLSHDEWKHFVGEDIPYEATCPNLPTPD